MGSGVVGLIGGMSWESSAEYYRLLNTLVRERDGGHHNARSLLLTVDFAEVEALQRAGDWAAAGRLLAAAARRLEAGGADVVLLCTNTMHRVADAIEGAIGVPFLHLVDVTADRVHAAGVRRVGLLGTRFTMEMDFYRDRMTARHGTEVLVPDEPGRTLVHDVIYDELTRGVVRDESRTAFLRVIDELGRRGAEAVVLGCTEIPLLVGPDESPLPVFDSTRIHVEAALDALR